VNPTDQRASIAKMIDLMKVRDSGGAPDQQGGALKEKTG
jgi:hypothetical protein